MTVGWHSLEPGAPLGVVALSGPVNGARLESGLETLRKWGHPVRMASNLNRGDGYLAGTDDERLAGIFEMLEGGARLLIAARGGYGAARLLPRIPWRRLVDEGVCFVGFSDVTAIINPLVKMGGAVQIHGPMVAAGLSGGHNAKRLLSVLQGDLVGKVLFRFPPSSVIRAGRASGPSAGGNLTLLTSSLGTPWEPEFDGRVLFLEEVGEPLYRLDRMLTHLAGSGKLRKVKALIGGGLRGCRPASERREIWRRLLLEAAPPEAPVVVGLPFGHGATNMAFPIGAPVEVDTDSRQLTWRS